MTLPPRRPLISIPRGMALIGRGRAEGLNCFRDTRNGFLGSLVPGLGFIVGALIEGLASGEGISAVTDLLAPICALLAPAVVSHEMARLFRREAFWLRYIVAFNWCQWLLPLALIIGLALGQTAGAAGIETAYVCVAGYALWINWFIARHALALSPLRAAGFVALANCTTAIIVFGPALLTAHGK
jgi:hypothetical protein